MQRYIYLLFFAGIVGQTVASKAQSPVIFSYSNQQTYFVQFEQGNRPEHSITNIIIRELAKGTRQRLEHTDYSFRFHYEVQLVRRRNRLTANVELQNFRFSGDTRYMGFEIADVLMPERVDFDVQLFQGNTLIKESNVQSTNLNLERNPFTIDYVDTLTNAANLRIVIPEFAFQYTSADRINFINRLALIDEYFAWDVSMNQMFGVMQHLNINDIDRLRENQQHLKQIFSGISQIKTHDFHNALRLWEYDPIGMIPRFNSIIALHQQLSQQMDYVVANLHVLYFERGQELVSTNPGQAREYFQAALRTNTGYVPAMVGMAQSFMRPGGNIQESISWVRRAYTVNRRDPQSDATLRQISQDINSRLIDQAMGFVRQNNHNEALRAWQFALDFCNSVPSAQCGDQITTGISRAHHGIYDEIFERAIQLFEAGNIDGAEQQVRQAIEYQRNNSRYITSANEAHGLMQDIMEYQYSDLIEQGQRNMSRQNFRIALEQFENARDIEINYPVERVHQLGHFIKQSKRPLLIADLETANGAIRRNELERARNLIDMIGSDMHKYDFMADNDILARYENIKGQLLSQHCINVKNHMEQLLGMADQSIMEGRFLAAEESFQEISNLDSQNSACGLGTFARDRRRAEVLPAINYQQALAEVRQLINERRFSQAVDKYNDAGRMFYHHGVERFRLQHATLFGFSKSFGNDFVLHVATLLANLGEGKDALNLILHLDAAGYPAKMMRNVQEITGRALARADFAANPALNPRQKVLEYTQGNRNIRFLRNAYVKQFNRLN